MRRKRYRSPPTNRRYELKRLSKDPNEYFKTVFGEESIFITGAARLREILYYSSVNITKDPRFSPLFGAALICQLSKSITEKRKDYFGRLQPHSDDYPKLIRTSKPHLSQHDKERVVDIVLKSKDNFYSQSKKKLANLCTSLIKDNDARAPKIFEAFYRNINPDDFDTLISKVDGGLDNADIQATLKKTKLFDYLKYDEKSIKNKKKREKLVKALAKTPTLVKRLKFQFKMTKDDIKQIAPAMRFNFLKHAYSCEVDQARRKWYCGDDLQKRIDYRKKRTKLDNLTMPSLTEEEMKELLFSVCLQKNEEFTEWMTLYKVYLEYINKPASESRSRNPFNRRYRWHFR